MPDFAARDILIPLRVKKSTLQEERRKFRPSELQEQREQRSIKEKELTNFIWTVNIDTCTFVHVQNVRSCRPTARRFYTIFQFFL